MAGFRVPHTLVLLFAMIVLALLASWLLPAGSYERVTNDAGREQVVAGSYAPIPDAEKLAPQAVLTAVPKGFAAAADIIFFIFIVGGAFAVFRETGAPDAAIGAMLGKLGHMPALLLFGGMFVFALGSSTIGMAEEYLPFVPLLLTLCVGLGYDALVAVGVLCVGYGVGYGAAAINPFTVLIAQDVAGVAPTSGMGYRLILFPVFLAVGFHHVWSYAQRVKRDPSTSLVADQPSVASAHAPAGTAAALTGTHLLILAIMVASLGFIVYGIKVWHWYLEEMGALFLGLAVILAVVGRMGPNRLAQTFCLGASELTTTALLVGFARAIQVVLDEGRIVDTIIHGIAAPLESLGAMGAAVGMFFVQSACNLFIPSGSGQAYVTMPLMAPLGDLVGVSRQIAVLAFQFGDGFTNIIVPTNAVLVGIMTMAGIPFDRWLRFVFPFILKIWLVGSIALAVAVAIGYQ
ncbi:YfcC family protein [Haliangium ochraceum]|uniref:C4-dicarboxylate anaerobic carrier-like protein n=1 Tax=Haliangium ochraceum (strain DSM 14365 / JCM 11303 / SMP-2) TaxID=502025 RepID=D0LM52_HALO1|nr:AbgT family transporter [Haliangium ochraceum]ACY16758.1 C4-dicarboxylate anaerobic carrier-like protein [Haliangium ochraceum DSM 14365]